MLALMLAFTNRPDKAWIVVIVFISLALLVYGLSDYLQKKQRNVAAFSLCLSLGSPLIGIAAWHAWPTESFILRGEFIENGASVYGLALWNVHSDAVYPVGIAAYIRLENDYSKARMIDSMRFQIRTSNNSWVPLTEMEFGDFYYGVNPDLYPLGSPLLIVELANRNMEPGDFVGGWVFWDGNYPLTVGKGSGLPLWIDRRFGGEDRWYLSPPKDADMRVPDGILKTAVFLGVQTKDGLQYKATGYIVSVGHGHGHIVKEQRGSVTLTSRYPRMHLVTAAHVAEELEGFDFYIRANKKDGTAAVIEADCNTRWWYHPTERDKVDAALMLLSLEDVMQLDISPIPVTMFVNDDLIATKNLGIGDAVFVAGLFTKAHGKERSIPIIRSGNVAMMPNEPITFKDRFEKDRLIYANLIESHSVGGLSGSPVFIRETIWIDAGIRFGKDFKLNAVNSPTPEIPGMEHLQLAGVGRFFFFGSTVGHWEVHVESTSTGREAVNMGVSPVVPAQKILEVIWQPELLQVLEKISMEKLKREEQETGKAVLDSVREKPFTKADFDAALKKAARKKTDKT